MTPFEQSNFDRLVKSGSQIEYTMPIIGVIDSVNLGTAYAPAPLEVIAYIGGGSQISLSFNPEHRTEVFDHIRSTLKERYPLAASEVQYYPYLYDQFNLPLIQALRTMIFATVCGLIFGGHWSLRDHLHRHEQQGRRSGHSQSHRSHTRQYHQTTTMGQRQAHCPGDDIGLPGRVPFSKPASGNIPQPDRGNRLACFYPYWESH